MDNRELTAKEHSAANEVLNWAKSYELVRALPGRRLYRVITPQDEEQYYTLLSAPEPRMLFHEPVRFAITVQEARGECRAGHRVGDRWECSWCTPAGMCGSAYHAMYPALHGLMLTSGRYEGPVAAQTVVACPDGGWITFRIQRHRWTPDDWEATLDIEENEP